MTSSDDIISLDSVISLDDTTNILSKVTYPWLRLDQKEKNYALFCKLCEAAKFNNNFVTGFTQQLGVSYLFVIQNLINTYWLAKNITATSKITDLTSLTEYHITSNIAEAYTFEKTYVLDYPLLESLEEPHANYGSYSNTHSAYKFISAIGRVIEEAICQEIQKSPVWSIMIDESNTITTTKNLAIVSKHISNNFPVYRYLGMIELKEGTANAIVNKLNIFLQAKNLPIDRLMNIGSDGASVMLECNNGVAAQFKKKNSYFIEHHCIFYHLALASEDAASSISYLHLKMVEARLEEPELHLLKIITTQWLSLSNVVSNLHRVISSVVQALKEDYIKSKTAKMLYKIINQNFLLTTHFLADILTNYVSLYEIKIQIDTVIQKIRSDFLATIENLQICFSDHKITNAFCIFDPRNLPGITSLNEYGNEEITVITNFYDTTYLPFIEKVNLIQE
ncbi:16636_t:CDS:2 [Cetraspora pellucida]|uniref:16636_t:CDS:1 n=1 Tax=Cetraspora pellucida TaxID=1433469 RepID=A0ACA9JW41_9GLOM|nr:16636_t:CDS:2 [Cetraspora pellucida]